MPRLHWLLRALACLLAAALREPESTQGHLWVSTQQPARLSGPCSLLAASAAAATHSSQACKYSSAMSHAFSNSISISNRACQSHCGQGVGTGAAIRHQKSDLNMLFARSCVVLRISAKSRVPLHAGKLVVKDADIVDQSSSKKVGKIVAVGADKASVLAVLRITPALHAITGSTTLHVAGSTVIVKPWVPTWWRSNWTHGDT